MWGRRGRVSTPRRGRCGRAAPGPLLDVPQLPFSASAPLPVDQGRAARPRQWGDRALQGTQEAKKKIVGVGVRRSSPFLRFRTFSKSSSWLSVARHSPAADNALPRLPHALACASSVSILKLVGSRADEMRRLAAVVDGPSSAPLVDADFCDDTR